MKKQYCEPEFNVTRLGCDVIQISAETFLGLSENDLGIYDIYDWDNPFNV